MFGFSLQKLLLLAAIVAAVWYGFKLVSRLQGARELDASRGGGKSKPARRGRKAASKGQTETMVQCPVCKTYVAARGAGSCGRDDCPY